MEERLVVYLGENLDFVELQGMPAFVEGSFMRLPHKLPGEKRFAL